MNWYLQSGKDSDVVVSIRIRYARNLVDFPFDLKNIKQSKALEEKIKDEVISIGYGLSFLKLRDIDDITKMSLVEKNLISPEFVLNRNETGAILINEEENICVMLNEEDHFRIQVFSQSFELESAFALAKEFDEKLQTIFKIAKSQKYGYLTSCPTNVGTGIRASVMVHLPGLSQTGNIKKVLEVIHHFGMNIRGIYGENSYASGDMYQISNQQTLGISEEEIIKNLKIIVEKVITQEREARKFLANNRIQLEDKIYRSYGILANCRKISSEEVRKLLSEIKLGTDLGIVTELTDSKVKKLYLYTKPASLQKFIGKMCNEEERDIERANMIKQIIEE